MKTVYQWLDEYNESHQNPRNKLLHWICVPAIALCVLGFANLLALPFTGLTFMHVLIVLAVTYYFVLSVPLGMGMLAVIAIGVVAVGLINQIAAFFDISQWLMYAFIFVVAWIGQFIGHNIEGKRPSFFQDLQFLMIGPLWLLSFIYKKYNINF